jgi:hypothetical protein
MKKCPKCNRTYADDAFTFCLEDGALLSAPYDPKEKPVSTIQTGGPPPTVALPSSSTDNTSQLDRDKAATPLQPTIASADPFPGAPKAISPSQLNNAITSRKMPKLVYIGITLFLLLLVGGISLYVLARSRCPNMDVTVRCSPSSSNSTGCLLLVNGVTVQGTKTVSKTNWTVSSGKVTLYSYFNVSIDTAGLAGREITVTATATTEHWFCSKTASTSYVVPQSLAPSK